MRYSPQFAVKIDKSDKRKDPRSGTVKAEIKVSGVNFDLSTLKNAMLKERC